ncbi:lipocalin-like domain-containing protein [Mycolicibacterium sphagni]|uniref:lipocalin-like domain-containing protein n=1 Tax=Mycolicibacterium sphagni TaxID=1786 RepID=UPI0021F399C6|nr:lipocalin-like domain-containing protein [Mycolicibacterium sphagni]MCV7174208.1 lipocalin-like domain-containing protein [Mycolicibacterium sphagni]
MIELTGAWQLVSVTHTIGNGKRVDHPFGQRPAGVLIYTADGQMSVHLSASDRQPLSSTDLRQVGDAELRRAFGTYLAYSGRYKTTEDTVIHEIETCSVPNMVGVDQVRQVSMVGDALVLRAPAIDGADGPENVEIRWARTTSHP